MTPNSAKSFPRAAAGFSLLEMVIVIAIIGLLIGVVIRSVGGSFGRSQEDIAKIFVQSSIKTPLTTYRIDMGDFPSTSEGLNALITPPSQNADRWRGPYLDVSGGKLPTDPWGQPYQYRYPGTKNPRSYDIFSKGPDKNPETADDIGNW